MGVGILQESAVYEAIKILGVALPLVVILIKQLEECRKERVETQKLFNDMLVKQADTYASMTQKSSESVTQMQRTISDVNLSIRDLVTELRGERKEYLEAMRDLHEDTLSVFRELQHGSG